MTRPALEPLTREARTAISAAVRTTPATLDAWRQLHYAAQAASEVGKGWGAFREDDSHSSFTWADGALRGVVIPAARPFRAVLHARGLVLSLIAEDGATLAERSLDGATLPQALAWVRAEAERCTGEAARQPAGPAPDLPAHALAAGAAFAARDPEAFASLASLLDAAHILLTAVAAALANASPVQIWPHHFDMATLASVAPDRTLGVGLAVPDALEAAGYWYVSPWAAVAPSATRWPSLGLGRWIERTGGLRMALLALDESAALPAFLRDAIAASLANLG